MLRHYTATTDPGRIEDRLDQMSDGVTHMIAVEVFDAPAAVTRAEAGDPGGYTIGPWVLGPADEVYAYLAERGWEDWAEQYSTGGFEEES